MSDAPPVTANKAELADILRTSQPTLNKLIKLYGADFPILHRGSNGIEWAFDPGAVIAFLRAKKDAAAAAGRQKAEMLDQYTLPGVPSDPAADLSPSDRLKMAKLRQIEREEAIRAAFLFEGATLRPLLEETFTAWRRDSAATLRNTLTENGISESVIRTIESRVNDAQNRIIDALQQRLIAGADAADGQQALF